MLSKQERRSALFWIVLSVILLVDAVIGSLTAHSWTQWVWALLAGAWAMILIREVRKLWRHHRGV